MQQKKIFWVAPPRRWLRPLYPLTPFAAHSYATLCYGTQATVCALKPPPENPLLFRMILLTFFNRKYLLFSNFFTMATRFKALQTLFHLLTHINAKNLQGLYVISNFVYRKTNATNIMKTNTNNLKGMAKRRYNRVMSAIADDTTDYMNSAFNSLTSQAQTIELNAGRFSNWYIRGQYKDIPADQAAVEIVEKVVNYLQGRVKVRKIDIIISIIFLTEFISRQRKAN